MELGWTLVPRDLPRGKNSPLKEDDSQICPRAVGIFAFDAIAFTLRRRTGSILASNESFVETCRR